MGVFLGIDLGTTFSAVAVLRHSGQPETIPNADGELMTPSAILFETDGQVIIGRAARRAAAIEPENVAVDVKRYLGDPHYPLLVRGRQFSPVELSALILKKLKQDAEARLGPIAGAVVTVPAYFNEARRQATAAACSIAGLRLLDILNEPTAAALAYAYRELLTRQPGAEPSAAAASVNRPRNSVVYDLGGGTFDVTVLRFEPGDVRVLATAGDVQLGGRDWDERIASHLADLFLREHGLESRDDAMSRWAFYDAAEEAKKELSKRDSARIAVSHGGKSWRGQLTRAKFEELTADLLFRTESRLNRVVQDAGLKWSQVDDVVLVGGSTRMPQVREMVRRVAGKPPDTSLSPDEAVAHGAAIHAGIVAANRLSAARAMPNRVPTSVPAPAPSAAPADDAHARRFTESLGSRILTLLRGLKTTNVSSHGLGVVTRDGRGRQGVSLMIPRNSPLPAQVTRVFGTETPNQRRVSVEVLEGDAPQPQHCIPVGVCHITGLPTGLPQGSPVEVTFRYDRSGRLGVEAMHVPSGKWAEITIERAKDVASERVAQSRDEIAQLSVS